MVIARKLLTPTLALFAIVLVVVIAITSIGAYRTLMAENNRSLIWLRQMFAAELGRMSDLALALAQQAAANPEVQTAFILDDRQQLMALAAGGFDRLKSEFGLVENQFTVAPATVVVNVGEPEKAGRDLTLSRPSLLKANQEGYAVSGLEMTEYGLGMHAAAPIRGRQAGGEAVNGSVDYSLAVDTALLQRLQQKFGGEWQLLLSQPAMTAAGASGTLAQAPGPRPDLPVQTSTFTEPLFASDETYTRALAGETVAELVADGSRTYQFITVPLHDTSGQVVGMLNIAWDTSAALQRLTGRVLLGALAGIAGIFIAGLILNSLIRRTLQPVQTLTVSAQAIAAGNLRQPLPVVRPPSRQDDEIDQLNRSFQAMAGQLRRLVGDLEGLVAERTGSLERRTNQLQAAADIGREVSGMSNPDYLMAQAVEMIRERFNFYQASVFLIDDGGEYALLQAATGDAGRELLAAGYRLEVYSTAGAGRGMVGTVCGTGRAQVAGEVTQNPNYYLNPLLPDTRSEAVLPLRAGDKIIGALDVQSTAIDAFGEDDITVLQMIADQLASAVSNSRLIATLNRTVADLETIHGQTTRANWRETGGRRSVGYRYTGGTANLQPEAGLEALDRQAVPEPAQQAMQTGRPVQDADGVYSAPVRLRDQVIGAVQVRYDTAKAGQDLPVLIEEVSGRLGMMLESARLLEEAQRLAQREQRINLIANEMRSSVNLESILQNTVRELGKSLGVRRAFIQLGEFDQPLGEFKEVSPSNGGRSGDGEAQSALGSEA